MRDEDDRDDGRQQQDDEQQQQEESMHIDKLSAAMAKAFPAIEGAVKGKVNPAFRSKYADLSSVIDAIKPHLAEHGLWFLQRTHSVDGGVAVETIILHASGQSMSAGVLRLPAAKQDAQGYGSALTYARRYSLMAAFGVPAEDDDGNAATGRSGGRSFSPAEQDKDKVIRDTADACIALHAAAVAQHDKTGDTAGFWELHRAASRIEGEDRMLLWEMLSKHSAVRAAIKEYAGYAAAEKKVAA